MTDTGKAAALAKMLRRLRGEWIRDRTTRLEYMKGLREGGMSAKEVRRDRDYRAMAKRQKGLSVRIRHIVKELNRRRSKAGECER